jgi:hypothetical protein
MSKAFVKDIKPYKSYKVNKDGQERLVHQTSPAWVLTFVRWANRDTYRYTSNVRAPDSFQVKDPMVVVNDCVQVTTTQSKATHTPMMSAMFKPGDINYETAIAPGDFVFLNIVDWNDYAQRIAERALNRQPINGEHDGFKGVFKVQSVRKMLAINPETGIKQLMFQIQAYGMTELNNSIYFNDQVIPPDQQGKTLLFFDRIGASINSLITKKGQNVQEIVKTLAKLCLGTGPSDLGKTDKAGNVISPNSIFLIPSLVGELLGIKNAKSVLDIYRFIFGIQEYAGGSVKELAKGLNPSNLQNTTGSFLQTNKPCTGTTFIRVEYWNQVTAWSLLQQYANLPINEMFASFKLNPDGKIMPTVTYRQIPFTTESFKGSAVTRFLNLPRWRISPAMIYDLNLGRDEVARINYVQVFGRTNIGQDVRFLMSEQIRLGNFKIDEGDIKRNGLRPWIISNNFDFPTESTKQSTLAPYWASLMADSIMGGHLKMNGHIKCAGIEEPIAPGDNLELDDVVYHIETVTHVASCTLDGKKRFETILELSNGVDIRSGERGIVYAGMDNIDIQDEVKKDYSRDGLLPGISDTQFSYAREDNGDTPSAKRSMSTESFTPAGLRKPLPNRKEEDNTSTTPKKSKGGRK